LLNVGNGTLNLKSGLLRQFNKADLITKLTPINYDPNATYPRFEKFLSEIMDGDLEKIRYLQKIVGYCLTGVTYEQVFFIFYGSGENGKTTLINVLLTLLGDYAKNTPITTFLRKNPNVIPHDVARLQGARFVTADETEEGNRLAEAQMKQLTGGGPVSARHLYSGTFTYEPTYKIVLDVNHLPVIKGTDHAIWRRPRPLPFTVTITPEKKDKTLGEKLKAELRGILRWAVEGALLWQKEGLTPPESVQKMTRDYREDQNILKKFVDDRCEAVHDAATPFSDLYDDFKEWCTDNGETLLNAKEFGNGLTDLGYKTGRKAGSGKRVRIGIKLRPLIATGTGV
jgi:putative DNA primase/helicase